MASMESALMIIAGFVGLLACIQTLIIAFKSSKSKPSHMTRTQTAISYAKEFGMFLLPLAEQHFGILEILQRMVAPILLQLQDLILKSAASEFLQPVWVFFAYKYANAIGNNILLYLCPHAPYQIQLCDLDPFPAIPFLDFASLHGMFVSRQFIAATFKLHGSIVESVLTPMSVELVFSIIYCAAMLYYQRPLLRSTAHSNSPVGATADEKAQAAVEKKMRNFTGLVSGILMAATVAMVVASVARE